MVGALLGGLGRAAVLRDKAGENPIDIIAILRTSDDGAFAGNSDGGRVVSSASIAFATDDAPAAQGGWKVTDSADGSVWKLGAPIANGRGMSRAELYKDS